MSTPVFRKVVVALVNKVGVEPVGAPTLCESVAAGQAVALDRIATEAGTQVPRSSDSANLAIVQGLVDGIVLGSDDEMRDAARWLWFEMGLSVELAAATRTYAMVCWAGTDGAAG